MFIFLECHWESFTVRDSEGTEISTVILGVKMLNQVDGLELSILCKTIVLKIISVFYF